MTTAGQCTIRPPAPIWADETSGMSVWVNGAMVEITLGDFARITSDEAALLPAAFAEAIQNARLWAARWDGVSRAYTKEVTPDAILR